MDDRVLDQIYEAAVVENAWPALLQKIADMVQAKGAVLVTQSALGVDWIASPRIQADVHYYMAEGWGADTSRVAPLFLEQPQGFRAETYYHPAAVLAKMPVHAEFLSPRGFGPSAATVIQGAADHAVHIAVEGFFSSDGPDNAIALLDRLRPHLSRAASLNALVRRERERAIFDCLEELRTGSAIVSSLGRLRALNDTFSRRLGSKMITRGARLGFSDQFLDRQFQTALERVRLEGGQVQSLAVLGSDDEQPFVVHILPLRGSARDLCESDGVLMLIADGANCSIPGADVLRLLYDLTPSEARLARLLTEGRTLTGAARSIGISLETARTQLRGAFHKTGVRRQSDLVRLLIGIAGPDLDRV